MGDLGNGTAAVEAVIEISPGRLQQLFNSFDPFLTAISITMPRSGMG
jgi:hypothetical protein